MGNPGSKRHRPVILSSFTFMKVDTRATQRTEDGIVEVARRARPGQKVKGMERVYDHVTSEMERQILESLEGRFLTWSSPWTTTNVRGLPVSSFVNNPPHGM